MKKTLVIYFHFICFCLASWGMDIDVTFIDRIPNYPYDSIKSKPEVGDIVTFIAHVKLCDMAEQNTNYIWYLDGLIIGTGNTILKGGMDNTVSIDWVWDGQRHEIMIHFDPDDILAEDSEENNIVYDFTDGLIVGIAVENSLIDAFPQFQKDLGIGSMSFEDWFQRQLKIWNLVLMEKAGELKSDTLNDIKDRVRGVLSYHADGTLRNANCPLVWNEVDMLWGKLASDIDSYANEKWKWFYEGTLPHELSHARYLPDTYIFDLPASFVEIIDDSGLSVTQTDYMPPFSWDIVYYNKNGSMMSGDYAERYSLFDSYLWNKVAGERALGCNTNGCCAHDTDWLDKDLPAKMYLKILHLDDSPWENARLDIYKREDRGYNDGRVDNTVDCTLFTDSEGRAELPSSIFTHTSYEFILKLTTPDGELREYRFVERTDFHIAFWEGKTDVFDYTIKTEFDPVPFADGVENVGNHDRGETSDITWIGRNFKEGGWIRFSNCRVKVNSMTYVSPNEIRANLTFPKDMRDPRIRYRLYNPDGKFVRIKVPYQQELHFNFNVRKPYAHFTSFDVHDRIPNAVYFNGLWSHDWAALFRNQTGPFPIDGSGPIKSYQWDFGDGSPGSFEPFVVRQFENSGIYNVTLTVTDGDNEIASTTKTIVFGDVPEISCSPDSMLFTDDGSPAGVFHRKLRIKNIGAGTLNYVISRDVAWLDVSPTNGSSTGNENEHTVSVDVSGLPQQTHNGSIIITAMGGINSPQTIPVSLIIPHIYPPLNFAGQKVLNRSLSQAEYINILSWIANPKNTNIVKYRIYRIEGENQNLLVELNADTFAYWHRRVEKDEVQAYSIVAVDHSGKEGLCARISIESPALSSVLD